MASSIPVEIIDDDDEFDWEAAVREIDVACQNNPKPSTPPPDISSSHFTTPVDTSVVDKNSDGSSLYSNKIKRPAACKQSTLDRFIAKPGPRAHSENRTVEDRHQECIDGDEKVSCVDIDAEAAKTWIYPVNIPLRDYQFAITKTALFSNTLVALPTGLGKTLIAAVVMYNYFRWFPEGKIVFAAPSRPLVMQQIEACHNIVGIPQEWTIDMTGQISPTKRALFWKSKRVFFVTPQVLEKDIQSGTCLVQYLVCLVIDEAHRALGNYSYCVAVRELMAIPVQLRILALTATPGSKQQAIQYIIDNLHIATLEYRNESDPDVSPYVHNRKLELIEVPLGKDAVEINNRLLEVIRPYVARLSSIGLIQNRDYQTLSPCDLLISRDKFRQAPPPDLPHVKHGDVESCFAALITLYHIRKLLSSHGIRPAYEMLEEKLQQGSFARLMSKNEDIRKAKLLMQQSLSHGAPSPKLSKMLEVLVDHFKTKDPQTSRVIIFSNFRGSVRDIMNALTNVGDLVKATEFIGQSSGKALKGQSQKVQQAVLEKFRSGGYNVIVATSIGEEGLDIMEVDLVICFDANVSPLRMIQRMGRTGRKHDGRVVVLACEGSELKGYMRKQANSRAINKHMQHGGLNSFNFHSSPRMIPHTFKPEVQFIELSIEQFIPRGKKLKDEHAIQTPPFKDKLTDAETDSIAKYFRPTREKTWRPSLIVFPHFQAFPSKVHKVMHSYRTGMLIDTMQCLQGLTFSGDSKTFYVEDEAASGECLRVDTAKQLGNDTKDSDTLDDAPSAKSQREVTDFEVSSIGPLRTKEKHYVPDFYVQSSSAHSYLFYSDFVSVDAVGKVLIMSVPLLPFQAPHSKDTSGAGTAFLNSLKPDSCHLKTSDEIHNDLIMPAKAVANLTTSQTKCIKGDTHPLSRLCKSDLQQGKMLKGIEEVAKTPISERDLLNEGDRTDETTDVLEIKVPSGVNDFRNAELSPRLTDLIKSGVVPESPISESGILKNKGRDEFLVPDLASPARFRTDLLSKSSSPGKNEKSFRDSSSCARNTLVSSTNEEIKTPLHKMNHIACMKGWTSTSPVAKECQTPLGNITSSSGSRDWHLSSGDKSENVGSECKFKRLRKVGDCGRNNNPKSMKESSVIPVANLARSFFGTSPIQIKHAKGKKGLVDDVRAFIDEEAEVSSEAEISNDEEDDQGNNSYDDSFIDDRTNPTASTQAESSRVDMMAIYRRSLLSQSPMERQPNGSATSSPDCVAPMTRINESGSSSGKSLCSLYTPQTKSTDQYARRNSESSQINRERISSEVRPCMANELSRENERKMESRKRKLSFCQSGSMSATNFGREFLLQSEAVGRESFQQFEAYKIDAKGDVFDDDQFYEGLDLDAVEAQATFYLRHKSDLPIQKQEVLPQPNQQNFAPHGSPSFDLGIW